MDTPDSFNTIGDAFVWYVSEGGQREKTSFYAKVPRSSGSKRISRFAVSEMLRKERTRGSGETSAFLDEEEQRLKVEKIRLEVRAKEREEGRELGDWMTRDDADFQTCTRLAELRDAYRYHFTRQAQFLIIACGGDINRIPELLEKLETQVTVNACNDVARNARREYDVEMTGE